LLLQREEQKITYQSDWNRSLRLTKRQAELQAKRNAAMTEQPHRKYLSKQPSPTNEKNSATPTLPKRIPRKTKKALQNKSNLN
jgi:hypothetical protein